MTLAVDSAFTRAVRIGCSRDPWVLIIRYTACRQTHSDHPGVKVIKRSRSQLRLESTWPFPFTLSLFLFLFFSGFLPSWVFSTFGLPGLHHPFLLLTTWIMAKTSTHTPGTGELMKMGERDSDWERGRARKRGKKEGSWVSLELDSSLLEN